MPKARIAVIVHVFYIELWPELAQCIKNIDQPYDLFVTIRPDSAGDKVYEDIRDDFPFALISRPEGVGYDVWPFFSVINDVDLRSYDIIVKLHTKRNMPDVRGQILNEFPIHGGLWRRYCLSFCATREAWKHSYETLMSDETIGMVASPQLILDYRNTPKPAKPTYLKAHALAVEKLHLAAPANYLYVGGNMFAVKAKCVAPLKGAFSANDFTMPDAQHSESLAQVVERVLPLCVAAMGMRLVPYDKTLGRIAKVSRLFRYLIRKTRLFFYQRKRLPNGIEIKKLFRLPIALKRPPFQEKNNVALSGNSIGSIIDFPFMATTQDRS